MPGEGPGRTAAKYHEGDPGQGQEAEITRRLFKARLCGGEYQEKNPANSRNYETRKTITGRLAKK